MKVEVGNLNGVNQPMPITLLPAQQEMIQTAVRKLSQKQDVQTVRSKFIGQKIF